MTKISGFPVYRNNQPNMLLEKKTGKLITTDEVDKKIYKKHVTTGVVLGAAGGLVLAEVENWKKNIPLNKKMLKRFLFPVTGAALFGLLGLNDIWIDKTSNNIGMTNSIHKAIQYQKRGYEPQYKVEAQKPDFKLSDALFLCAGIAVGVANGIKGDKVKLPAMEWAYSDSKIVSATVNAIGNGLVYGVVGRVCRAIFEKVKGEENPQKA